MNVVKAICDGRRKHDQVPHAVHDQILTLEPAVPDLEVKSTQLGVEALYDKKAEAAIAELRQELARVQAEIDKAMAESDASIKKAMDAEAKWLKDAQGSREEMVAATAKYTDEKTKTTSELISMQRRKFQLEALEKSEERRKAAEAAPASTKLLPMTTVAPAAGTATKTADGVEDSANDWTPLDANLLELLKEVESVRTKMAETTMRRKTAMVRKMWVDRQLVTLDAAMAKAMKASAKKGKGKPSKTGARR